MIDGLYGTKKPPKTKGKEISSSTSLAFSSNLTSLISSSSSKGASSSKSKSSKGKSDLFTAHKQNAKKRAAKELEDENGQKHQTKDDLGSVSTSELHRSKKRMEEKVRIYNAMKRGEYIGRDDGYDDRGLVDFDRKWAEKHYEKEDSDESEISDEDSADDEKSNEVVEYMDEFGRLRKGTKKQAKQEERRGKIQAIAREEAAEFAARPQAPTNVIYGDAVQHQAFNPDRTIAEQMAELAKKRDKEATPPPETHFDANAEVRTKGTGFYTFSHDAEERRKEMEDLEKARLETERIRAEKQKEEDDKAKTANESTAEPTDPPSTVNADAQRFLDEFELT